MISIISRAEADKRQTELRDMVNKYEILKVVTIEVPKGGKCQGTKVKLSNGQYLTGIKSITLRGDTESPLWSLSLEVMPDFVDQQILQAEYAHLSKYDEGNQVEGKLVPPEIETPPIKLE